MRKYIYQIFLVITLLAAAGCDDDFLTGRGGTLALDGDVPVDFSFIEPAVMSHTRSTDDYKKLFEEGDVIHIQGTFTSAKGETATTYGAMRLESRKWVPVAGSTLYWPYDAEKGTFKAYHLYNSNGVMPRDSRTTAVSLSSVRDNEDPLEAVVEDVPYGYAVNLKFRHACTYLTLEKMEQNVTDYFWMVQPGAEPIKNAYRLTLGENGELALEFVSVPDPSQGGEVYVSRPSEPMTVDGKGYSRASFYLAPGAYSQFDLRTNNNFPFMSFRNSLTEPLLANHPYTLNVENARGSNFVTITQSEWDEDEEPWQVDVKEFLKAVAEGHDYVEHDGETEVPILKSVNGVLTLMRNLDFQYFKSYGDLGFNPDISNSLVFDGNLHYIVNIGYPVFRFNYGTVQNLGLKDLRFEVTAYEGTSDYNYANDFSRIGGLCLWNRSDSKINNVRLENFDMTVKIQAEDPREKTYNENYNIGGLCGENWGSVSGVTLKGDFSITVGPRDSDGKYSYVDANINLGGVIGNHTLYLSDVGPQAGSTYSLTLTNLCRGREEWGSGVFCVGGAVGLSTANEISQVVVTGLKVVASESDGYQQYTGGIAGRLRGDNYVIADCTVQGSLTCGTVSPYASNATNAYSYVGGISGNVRGYAVSNCRAVCDINANTDISADGLYATGGAFGRILSGVVLLNNSAFGNVLTGPANYIGTFAGISVPTITWQTLLDNGNTARSIGSYPPIGTAIEDSDI